MRVLETVAGLQGRDHEVLVLSPLRPRLAPAKPSVAWGFLAITGNLDFGGHRMLLTAMREFRPDIVFLHAGSPGELAMAAALAAARAPAVIVEHLTEYYPLRSRLRDAVLARLKRRADRWLAVSLSSARALETMWQLPPGRVGVLRNGVEAPPTHVPSEDVTALFAGADVVLGVGGADTRKGLDVFSQVADGLAPGFPGVRFVWAGTERRERRGAVTLLPWSESVGWMMGRARLLVMPSRAEGLPLVLLEAWASGLAVVASAVGGVPEIVEDGVNGLLLPPDDGPAWTASVARLLADGETCGRLARNGHETWRGSFTAEAMGDRYDGIVESVLEARSGAFRSRSLTDKGR